MRKEYLIMALLPALALAAVLCWAQENPAAPEPPDMATPLPPDAATPAPEPAPAPKDTSPDPETMPVEIISSTYKVLPVFKMGDEINVEEEQKWD
ncbi:MAG: hypothetical protein AB1599_03930, partial [Planctomycetota bacterium]